MIPFLLFKRRFSAFSRPLLGHPSYIASLVATPSPKMIPFLLFKRTFSAFSRPKHNQKTATFDLPHEIDWRKAGVVTPITNQGQCGSCWAFATAGAIEGIKKIVTGSLVTLSPQELVDCCIKCSGCCGGNRSYAFEYVLNNGLSLEADYRYTARKQPCKRKMLISKPRVWIDGYAYTSCHTPRLMKAVAQQPVTAALRVGRMFRAYKEGVFKTRDDRSGLHAILIVGYCTYMGERCWIIKNSWGEGWGVNGYGYVSQEVTKPGGIMKNNPIYPIMWANGAASLL